MSKMMYLNDKSPSIPGALALRVSQNMHNSDPTVKRTPPWPISPNITPKRKGKVTHVNTLGFTSL
jgi:hypothetical protein